MQDASLQESMGPVVDRTKENLVSTDNGIIMARHRLLRAVKAMTDKGTPPPGIDPAHQRCRSAAVVLPPDQPFKDAARDALVVQRGRGTVTSEPMISESARMSSGGRGAISDQSAEFAAACVQGRRPRSASEAVVRDARAR